MSFRVAIGGIAHESNTFRPRTTPLSDFKEGSWYRGDELLQRYRGTRTSQGGMLAAAEALGGQVAPSFYASCTPSGTIEDAAFETMLDKLVSELKAVQPFDAICLSLHGAGVTESEPDMERAILAELRRVFGDLPMAATLDLHGNLSDELIQLATCLFPVHEYPHVDMYERGEEAMQTLAQVLAGKLEPVMHFERVPMQVTGPTSVPPMSEFNQRCVDWEARDGIIHCAIMHGFSAADVPQWGMAVLAVADGDLNLAREAAVDVAGEMWRRREELRRKRPTPEEAVAQAMAMAERPIVLHESSDNPGGGAPGDSTYLLQAMMDAGVQEACFAWIVDPESVRACHQAGVGAELELAIGGKSDPEYGEPVRARVRVKVLSDGQFTRTSPMGAGTLQDMGPMARVQLGGIDLLLATRRKQVMDDEVFRLHGIDVSRYHIVAVKSAVHFRAGFEPLAAAIIAAHQPQSRRGSGRQREYRHRPRPVWPMDEGASYTPTAAGSA